MYIPANLSRYRTVRSVATIDKIDEQLVVPMKFAKIYIDPSMLNRSCWLFLQQKDLKGEVSISSISIFDIHLTMGPVQGLFFFMRGNCIRSLLINSVRTSFKYLQLPSFGFSLVISAFSKHIIC